MPVFLDRIYRISQIFSQFPDETEKGQSAYGGGGPFCSLDRIYGI
jgi:hypothetical protein